MLKAAKSGSEAVRFAAIRGMERSGNGSCLPVLLEAATAPPRKWRRRPWPSWRICPARKWTTNWPHACRRPEGKARLVLIQLAGRRHIASANPLLLKAIDDPDGQVRCAALTALGATDLAG